MTTINKDYNSIKSSLKQLILKRDNIVYSNARGVAYSPAYNRIVLWFPNEVVLELQETDEIYTNN